MASIRTWDYYCKHCDTTHKDVVYTKTCKKTIKCSCGKRAGWAFIRRNQIHSTLSGRKYEEMDKNIDVRHTGERQLDRIKQGDLIEGPWGI
jgi:hypothetical protein